MAYLILLGILMSEIIDIQYMNEVIVVYFIPDYL